jgi:polysaccharide biosynthesis protein PslG
MTTNTAPVSAPPKRRPIRGFVIIWTFITLLMGLATFAAIFFAYDNRNRADEVALAPASNTGGDPIVVIASPTPLPTQPVQATAIVAIDDPPTTVVEQVQDEPTTQQQQTQPTQVAQAPTQTPEATFVPPDEDQRFQVGVQIQVPQDLDQDVLDGYYRTARQNLGVRWVKKQVRWELVEPQEDAYNFAELDLAMDRALYFNINMMLSIVTTPDWAREPGADLSEHGPPADNEDYVDFVRQILNRYDGRVFAVEVWNEQNLAREWTSPNGLSATNYMEMLRATYNMVQEESPGTIVISGALAPTGVTNDQAVDDFLYLERLIDAGLLDYADCVGAHHNGYNISPLVRWDAVPNDPTATYRGPFDNPHHSWSFRSTLEGYIQRIRSAGADTKLCVTEFGWAVTEDLAGTPRFYEYADDNTLAEQAQYFTDALELMATDDSVNVWLAFIWNLNYGPQVGWDPSNDNVPYSLIGPEFSFRPAFDAIRDWYAGYRERTNQT